MNPDMRNFMNGCSPVCIRRLPPYVCIGCSPVHGEHGKGSIWEQMGAFFAIWGAFFSFFFSVGLFFLSVLAILLPFLLMEGFFSMWGDLFCLYGFFGGRGLAPLRKFLRASMQPMQGGMAPR